MIRTARALNPLPVAPIQKLIGQEDFSMDLPAILKGESIARLLQGTAFGAIAAMIIGFNWGGWILESTAAKQSEEGATSAVVALLAPLCVDNFQSASDASSNLEEFKKQSSYKRTSFVEKGGWANLPGSDKASKGVAKACASLLNDLDVTSQS
jgi:hypothetical protein